MKVNISENRLSPGLSMCGGCGLELTIRTVFGIVGDDIIEFGGPGCCLITERCAMPCYGTLFSNMAPSASGVSRQLLREGKDTTCVCIAGDGMACDIAFGNISAAAERGEHLLFVCYDNEAYMNTGIQRSSRTPAGGWTNTTPVGAAQRGKKGIQKPVPLLLAEHNIAYCATASLSHMPDMKKKIEKAKEATKHGFAYLHVFAPCPTGWKAEPSKLIELCRTAVQSNYFPLWEAEYGKYRITVPVKNPVPVTEFTRLQRRFAHMTEEEIALLQRTVDESFHHIKKLCAE